MRGAGDQTGASVRPGKAPWSVGTDLLGEAPGVAFVNLGCRVNRDELDDMASALLGRGLRVVPPQDASAIVVNSCAVTGEAEAKTRKQVRHMAGLPQAPEVVVTGCVANLFEDELSCLAPNVSVVPDKSQVASRVLDLLGLGAEGWWPSREREATGTPTGRTRPGIKIQDGCDNRCTYCIVWKARGAARSLPAGQVLDRVRSASAAGAAEVVLSGINIGSYAWEGLGLPGLLDLLMRETDVGRVRIGSIEPPDVTQDLLATMAAWPDRLAPFLHVCLQAGCDRTLERMGRAYDAAFFEGAVRMARQTLPDLALGTDVIVGFPGETDRDFEESYAFCERMAFSKMHVFRYSRRPGTPAAQAPDQVPPQVAAERGRRLRALSQRMRTRAAQNRLGREDLVVVERRGRGVTGGLLDVRLDPSLPVGSLVWVRASSVLDDGSLLAVRSAGHAVG